MNLTSTAKTPTQFQTETESYLRFMAGQKFGLAKTCAKKSLAKEYEAAGHALADAADAIRGIKFID